MTGCGIPDVPQPVFFTADPNLNLIGNPFARCVGGKISEDVFGNIGAFPDPAVQRLLGRFRRIQDVVHRLGRLLVIGAAVVHLNARPICSAVAVLPFFTTLSWWQYGQLALRTWVSTN